MSVRYPVSIPCVCGCGGTTKGQSKSGYLPGHQNRGRRHAARFPGFPPGVQIDSQDFDAHRQHSWSVSGNGYLQRHHTLPSGKHTKIRLHRELMGNPAGLVDHINGNKLDNRRCNLRVVDDKGNAQNQGLSSKSTSGYRGVSWRKALNKWYAYGKVDGKMVSLGFYSDLAEAAAVALAYRKQHYATFVQR